MVVDSICLVIHSVKESESFGFVLCDLGHKCKSSMSTTSCVDELHVWQMLGMFL